MQCTELSTAFAYHNHKRKLQPREIEKHEIWVQVFAIQLNLHNVNTFGII